MQTGRSFTLRPDGRMVLSAAQSGVHPNIALCQPYLLCLHSNNQQHHVLIAFLPLCLCLQVGFETEGTAIYDTMCYLKNEVRSRPFSVYGHNLS